MRVSLLVLAGGVSTSLRAQTKHLVTLDDLLTLKDGQYPQQLSPSGSMVAYWMDGNIWIVATRAGSIPRSLGKGYLPLWSPDEKLLAYYSGEPGNLQLWVFDMVTNKATQITHFNAGIDPDPLTGAMSGRVSSALQYSWSPDGTKLVFSSQLASGILESSDDQRSTLPRELRASGSPLVLTTTTPPEWTLAGIFVKAFPKIGYGAFWERARGISSEDQSNQKKLTNQLLIVDIRSKEIRQLTTDESTYAYPNWSPDGKRIVCISLQGRGWMSGVTNIYVIDVETGKKSALTTDSSGTKGAPAWSPDGKYIAYLNRGRQSKLFVISGDGGDAVDVTSRLDRYVMEFVWLSDSRSIIVGYVDAPSFLALGQVSIAEQSFRPVAESESAGRAFITISRSGALAWQQSDPSNAWAIRILRPGQQSSSVLIDFNPQVKQWLLGDEEVLQYKNHRGDEMSGILIKPVNYKPGRRYPLIVDAYPLKINEFKGWPMKGNQAWAARGYAVFMPISRAPNGVFLKSEAYTKAAQGPKGWDVTVDDIMSGVDEVINRGIADPDRMALYGFSNGGGVVNYLVTRTNRFKCAVSVAPGLSDWIRPILMHTGFAQLYSPMMGGKSLWDDLGAYVEMSSVFRVDRVKTPMLLAVGDQDGEFLLDQIEMYNGLRQFGQEVTLLRYADQRHGFSGAALKDFWERENAFFDKYLKPEAFELSSSSDSSANP